MSARVPSLSIVVPCYEEAANVERVVRGALTVTASVAALRGATVEVVVVDDGSLDRTGLIADALAAELPAVRVVHHARNLGYGAALRSGVDAARGTWILLTDGDGQFDLAELGAAIALLDAADCVIGYRVERADPLPRLLLGAAWTALTNAVLGLNARDTNCAFKLLPRSLFERLVLHSDGALISAELLCAVRDAGLRSVELGIRHHPRASGRATGASAPVILRALRELAEAGLARTAERASVAPG